MDYAKYRLIAIMTLVALSSCEKPHAPQDFISDDEELFFLEEKHEVSVRSIFNSRVQHSIVKDDKLGTRLRMIGYVPMSSDLPEEGVQPIALLIFGSYVGERPIKGFELKARRPGRYPISAEPADVTKSSVFKITAVDENCEDCPESVFVVEFKDGEFSISRSTPQSIP